MNPALHFFTPSFDLICVHDFLPFLPLFTDLLRADLMSAKEILSGNGECAGNPADHSDDSRACDEERKRYKL